MAKLVSQRVDEPWRRRLYLPAYQIGEAAKYAQVSPQTVVAWHRIQAALLNEREKRAALNYMQLIEVAVVAAFRKAGVPMPRIRAAREYAAKVLKANTRLRNIVSKKTASISFSIRRNSKISARTPYCRPIKAGSWRGSQ